MSKKVAVIMGSDSDWPVVKAACAQLTEFGMRPTSSAPTAPLPPPRSSPGMPGRTASAC